MSRRDGSSAGSGGPVGGPGAGVALGALGALLLAGLTLAHLAAPSGPPRSGRVPTLADEPYGRHPRQVLDLWLPRGRGPHPLVVWIHGGGFATGDKERLAVDRRERLLGAGIAVAAVNYRLTPEVAFPAAHLDVARALQTLRHRAAGWGIDPQRVAGLGHSAGGGIALWLGFHDDLARPGAADPVARHSTRLTAVAALDSQSSYDPFLAAAIGLPRLHLHPFFRPFYGLGTDQPFDTPELRRRYREASAVTWLTADDPPVWTGYRRPDLEIRPATKLRDIVHHPRFGLNLCRRMQALGLECVVGFPGREPALRVEEWLATKLAP